MLLPLPSVPEPQFLLFHGVNIMQYLQLHPAEDQGYSDSRWRAMTKLCPVGQKMHSNSSILQEEAGPGGEA